ncbi:MAG: hypothetical protein ACRDI1_04500 [Actinomycetota bacterium]
MEATHGDDRHITHSQFKAAAEAAEISVEEAKKNLVETLRKAGDSES